MRGSAGRARSFRIARRIGSRWANPGAVKYDNDPVPGLKETDTVLAVALVVSF